MTLIVTFPTTYTITPMTQIVDILHFMSYGM